MKFSFDCPHCGKSYRNVKTTLRGRKARCSCGSVIRIGEPPSAKSNPKADSAPSSGGASRPTSAGDPNQDKPKKQLDAPNGGKNASSSPIPTVEVKVEKTSLMVDDHFSDLDDILSGRGLVDEPRARSTGTRTSPPRNAKPVHRPTRPDVAEEYRPEHGPPPEIFEAPIEKPPSKGATIGLLAVIASATLAFWFGLLIVLVRFVEIEQVLLKRFADTITALNVGKFGTEKISESIQFGFVAIGWAMWVVALLLMLFAIGQFLNGIIKLFIGRSLLRWVDGSVAGLAIVFVFLVVGSLFLQSSHMTALNRELNQFENPGAVGESSPQNVMMIRESYRKRHREFMTVMAISGIIPFSIFAFSMVRLFTLTGESPKQNSVR